VVILSTQGDRNMKIINMGILPLDALKKPFTLQCGYCRTKIEVHDHELKQESVGDMRDGYSTASYVECPLCKDKLYDSSPERHELRKDAKYAVFKESQKKDAGQ